ncbi:GNAT family N-acetyltransferase [Undibacterium fentianense]|uniref:GNAT family N-acetyltransferase n=1 Tax=Undibacterium fentianense TaxID=2828728 RepID=A0A941E2L3_9BURK|nr:GNAT family N-acetyltransferase [Undibacterium fentianense]MBR7799917.1 GNAT family N-acetyltransferase [Undibacterium fentianense]
MNISIQRANLHDIDTIAPLFDAYRCFYQQTSDLKLAKSFLTERINRQESILFLAQNDDQVGLGFVQLYPSFSSVSAQRLWILNDLYVTQSARRQGIAKRLMNCAKEFAIADNAKGLFLETAHDNIEGQSLYESLGYRRNPEFYYFLDLRNQPHFPI